LFVLHVRRSVLQLDDNLVNSVSMSSAARPILSSWDHALRYPRIYLRGKGLHPGLQFRHFLRMPAGGIVVRMMPVCQAQVAAITASREYRFHA
jgi:hypothetical protein